jgi:hydroxymethylpyrimidine/phosphomethylpyrimidine kinase
MMVKKTTRFPGAADPDAADGRVRINNQGGNPMSDAPTARALTVAGSDSGGGAGIQADLKTFQEWLVYGMSVVTAVTAQNSLGVHGVWPLPADAVERQLRAVLEDFGADAVKTGMLPDRAAISATARVLAEHRIRRVVVDPVMVAKGGAALMEDGAVSALVNELLPLAELVTPNVPEACRLAGLKEITTLDQMAEAAVRIHRLGVRSVLVKGGHLTGLPADDLLFDGEEFLLYRGPRLSTIHTHGTGCTLSAAIAAALALGMSLADAVRAAKIYVTQAIRAASRGIAGRGIGPLDHGARRRRQAEPDGHARKEGVRLRQEESRLVEFRRLAEDALRDGAGAGAGRPDGDGTGTGRRQDAGRMEDHRVEPGEERRHG